MRRVTLTDRDGRESQMKDHVKMVAEAILTDLSGDELFAKYLSLKASVHRYSIGNRMLQMWQAPDSALVASRTSFSKMAAAQGHTGRAKASKPKGGRSGKSWEEFVYVARGSNAVWIWGAPRPTTYEKEVRDPSSGETTKVPTTFNRFFPTDVYQAEDIRYTDDDQPFVIPSFVVPVDDLDLYEATLSFAAHKGIEVNEEGLNGAAGVSRGGSIATQKGQTWQQQLPTILHEVAHELLHQKQGEAKLSREVCEGEAESVAATLLLAFGHGIGASCAYLRNWKCDEKDVLASMDRISRAASEVYDFIVANQQEELQAAVA